MNNHKTALRSVNCSRIGMGLATALRDLREGYVVLIIGDDLYATKVIRIKRCSLDTLSEKLDELGLGQGGVAIFEGTKSLMLDEKKITIIKNDLNCLGVDLIEWSMVCLRKYSYASEYGILPQIPDFLIRGYLDSLETEPTKESLTTYLQRCTIKPSMGIFNTILALAEEAYCED